MMEPKGNKGMENNVKKHAKEMKENIVSQYKKLKKLDTENMEEYK